MPAFSQSQSNQSKKKATIAPSYAWTVQQPLGLRDSSTIDTLLYNYYKQSIPSEMSDAWATTGALGAEGIGKDVTMIVGNGYTKNHAEITLNVLRENPKLRKLFDEKYC